MRIIAGQWRGRNLAAPPGKATRPTTERVRQALFDALVHAPWGGPEVLRGVRVADLFAGTGALGLEALSRGAAGCTFVERDPGALAALRRNVAACRAELLAEVVAGDALRPPAGPRCGLLFLDPPYGEGLVERSLAAWCKAGRIEPGAVAVTEIGCDEELPEISGSVLDDRRNGAARIVVWRINP